MLECNLLFQKAIANIANIMSSSSVAVSSMKCLEANWGVTVVGFRPRVARFPLAIMLVIIVI